MASIVNVWLALLFSTPASKLVPNFLLVASLVELPEIVPTDSTLPTNFVAVKVPSLGFQVNLLSVLISELPVVGAKQTNWFISVLWSVWISIFLGVICCVLSKTTPPIIFAPSNCEAEPAEPVILPTILLLAVTVPKNVLLPLIFWLPVIWTVSALVAIKVSSRACNLVLSLSVIILPEPTLVTSLKSVTLLVV